jgi:hypothetical protein
MQTYLANLKNISPVQEKVMLLIGDWARKEKTPITKKEIMERMQQNGENVFAVNNAILVLIRKGYLRKTSSFRTAYVQLRSV